MTAKLPIRRRTLNTLKLNKYKFKILCLMTNVQD